MYYEELNLYYIRADNITVNVRSDLEVLLNQTIVL